MTIDESIKIIKECKEKGFKYTFFTLNQYHEALDMAIFALKRLKELRNTDYLLGLKEHLREGD